MVHGPSTVGYGRASARRHSGTGFEGAATGLTWCGSGPDTKRAPDKEKATNGARSVGREGRERYKSASRGRRRSEG